MTIPRARNVIYIVSHDLGRHLGCYGAGVESPALDAFAAQGARLTRAFCSSPACSPSRACAYTGLHAHTSGMMGLANPGGWNLAPECRTVVDELNDHGIDTVHVGLQHERLRAIDNRYRHELCTLTHDSWRDADDEFAEVAVDRVIAWLRQRDPARRFYLNLGTIEGHESRWSDQITDAPLQQRSRTYGRLEPARLPPGTPDTPVHRERFARFGGAIRFLDRQLGRLFAAVQELGLAEDTLVVFTTDHGIANPRSKGWLYGAGVEIALLARLPGAIASGTTPDALIQNIDVAPTLLDAFGLPTPARMQGRSFWPLLTGQPYAEHEHIVITRNWHDTYAPMRSVRTRTHHYLRWFGRWPADRWLELHGAPPREELYDVAADPLERDDRAGDPALDGIRRGLSDALDRWMRATADPLLEQAAEPAAPGH